MIPALPEPAVQLPPGEYSVTTTGELVPFYVAAQLEQYARDYHAAQMGEPFGYFKAEPFGWTDCAETDEGAIALYELKEQK